MATDDVQKFMELNEQAGELKTRKIRLEEQCKAKETELQKLVAEVKKAGYQPKDLKKVIDEKSAQIEKDIAEFEAALKKASEELAVIEEG